MHGHGQSGHGGEPTADATTTKVSNKPRGNSHWTSDYMPLHENLGGDVGKGVLTRRGRFCGGTHTDGEETSVMANGVVEAVEEEDGEELHGGMELAVSSAGWGNNWRRLPPTRCSRRKMTAGKSRGPASLAGASGRLLV
jgi:hypothetical protein